MPPPAWISYAIPTGATLIWLFIAALNVRQLWQEWRSWRAWRHRRSDD